MRLLLDECVPARLRLALQAHEVSTVAEQGWAGIKNGVLLALAAEQRFEALVTVDKNLPYQQNARSLPVAVVVLDSPSNALAVLLRLVPELEASLAHLPARSYVVVKGGP